jgi:hypothetical protein
LAVAVVVVVALNSKSLAQLGHIGQPEAGWLCAAIAAELASMLAYALIVRELMRLGAVTPRDRSLLRPIVAC